MVSMARCMAVIWNDVRRCRFELLYRPLDACWALGVDVNYVKQRDWDNMMRFTDYSTPTGFVTAYWNPPTLNGVLMKLSVGQYLAKIKAQRSTSPNALTAAWR